MKISEKGLNLIKQFEMFCPTVYICPAGYPTIGYGHKLLANEKFNGLTLQQADELLMTDLEPVEKTINLVVKVPITQNQFDALCSFIYNIGVTAFKSSTLLKYLNESDYKDSSLQFAVWIYERGKVSNGLARRRKLEAQLFNSTD